MRIRSGLFTQSLHSNYSSYTFQDRHAMWKRFHEIHDNHSNEVHTHLRTYKRQHKKVLRKLIAEHRAELLNHPLYIPFGKLVGIAKLHAAEMALHPQTSAVVIVDRGVYAEKAVLKAKERGHRTILLCEPQEVTWRAATLADHVLPVTDLGNVDACMQAIQNFVKVIGVHGYGYSIDPGFGKLSENPALPEACLRMGYVFAGPPASPMSMMGNKKLAKELAESCGVPVVPGYYGEQQDLTTLKSHAVKMGFPLMVKKGRSGGGYGNKRVNDLQEFCSAVEGFRSGDKDEPIFFEKFLTNPMHIEVQAVIAKGEVVLLGTRNCSLQRDCQKTIEEAPATIPQSSEILRQAFKIAEGMMRLGYTHLGTIEFLVQDGNIYFLEINPRIQVEHGITEVIHHGLDLIAFKYWIAGGGKICEFLVQALHERNLDGANLSPEQMIALLREKSFYKFAIEARVEAIEFKLLPTGKLQKLPVKGVVTEVTLSEVNTPCGIMPGSEVNTTSGNPLLATVIGKGGSRLEALQDLHRQLSEMSIGGIPTNLPRLRDNVQYLIDHPDLVIDTTTTQMLDLRPVQEPTLESPAEVVYGLYNRDLLFKERDMFASAESRHPVVKYHHRVGRGGSWD